MCVLEAGKRTAIDKVCTSGLTVTPPLLRSVPVFQTSMFFFLLLAAVVAAAATPSCNEWPHSCPGTVPAFGQTWQMNKSTIIMPCNTTGFTNPQYIKGWSTVDFDWSNAKGTGKADGWAKHQPMDDEEMLYKQVKIKPYNSPPNPDTNPNPTGRSR